MRTLLLLILAITAGADTLLLRSEFDTVGYTIGTIPASTIVSGNSDGYYTLDAQGTLTVAKDIPDQFDIITSHEMVVSDGNTQFTVTVVDGYDYLLQQHEGTVLNNHQQIDTLESWTAYNNLWGDGTAVPNQDYRTAILINDSLPHKVTFLWDTPGPAKDFGGSSVWSYTNLMFGNRYGLRDDLEGFPFKVTDLTELTFNFDYTPYIGDDQWKVALNLFLTDSDTLSPFSQNRGDFFMVFDQKGTWIPPYPDTVVADTTILDKPFTLLYKDDASGYEWRRVIIKNHARLQKGSLNLLSLFNRFAEEGYLKKEQSIPNIQFGIEVTSGWGAVVVDSLSIIKKTKGTAISKQLFHNSHQQQYRITQLPKGFHLQLQQPSKVELLSPTGRLVQKVDRFLKGVIGDSVPIGFYLLRIRQKSGFHQQKIFIP